MAARLSATARLEAATLLFLVFRQHLGPPSREHQERRWLSFSCIPPNDVNIVCAFIEGLACRHQGRWRMSRCTLRIVVSFKHDTGYMEPFRSCPNGRQSEKRDHEWVLG
jgi:hypothetical protein